ncbi:MAG: hypothetical protein ABIB47_01450 [Candidatus Woesearchaeota archaeon]
MNHSDKRYNTESTSIYIINEKYLEGFLEEDGLDRDDLEKILDGEEQKDINRDSIEEYLASHISSIRIKSSLPTHIQAYLNGLRKIGFDHPGLIPKRALTPKTPVYVSQQFLNNIAGVTNGRVLGAYDRDTDTVYILNTLTGEEHDEVLVHEDFHRKHPGWSEPQVRRATALAGYNRFQGAYN